MAEPRGAGLATREGLAKPPATPVLLGSGILGGCQIAGNKVFDQDQPSFHPICRSCEELVEQVAHDYQLIGRLLTECRHPCQIKLTGLQLNARDEFLDLRSREAIEPSRQDALPIDVSEDQAQQSLHDRLKKGGKKMQAHRGFAGGAISDGLRSHQAQDLFEEGPLEYDSQPRLT